MDRRTFNKLVSLGAAADLVAPHLGDSAPLPVTPDFEWLKFGEVEPLGWIKAQMERDLREGFAGHLDELTPEVRSDIFGSGRNAPGRPNLHQARDSDYKPPYAEAAWWNGESEGNYRTGYIMMAYMSGNIEAKRRADSYVAHILQTQDKDGYIGIYSPELRWSQSPYNGELWTQTCIMRGLLAYYEFTKKAEVLHAVERAVQLTISNYGPDKLTAFRIPGADGGVFHGLMFTDVVEQLFDLIGNPAYRDFGVWLYKDFCEGAPAGFADMTVASLLDLNKPWIGHGAHTYEHIRSLLWVYYSNGNSEYRQAYENALIKLHRYELPSGAAVSMEGIDARRPDPTEAYYEYCAIKESLTSYISGLQKTGMGKLGDSAEKILFNAAEGARTAQGKAITYCTCDNRYAVDAAVLGRNKFSPTQNDVAVCCVPNAVQIFPLFVRGMWMKTPGDGLAAVLYGPSSVNTKANGVQVRLEEQTDYPFSSLVSIAISPERSVDFSLTLRNPGWSKSTEVTCPGAAIAKRDDYFVVRKTWGKNDQVTVKFNESVRGVRASNRQIYLQRGPLVYALRVPAHLFEIKQYSLPGFEDLAGFPADGADWLYGLDATERKPAYGLTFERDKEANLVYPFDGAPIRLEGNLMNFGNEKMERISLIPMGSTLAAVRRVTFPLARSQDGRV
jgi:uncharacterized protein